MNDMDANIRPIQIPSVPSSVGSTGESRKTYSRSTPIESEPTRTPGAPPPIFSRPTPAELISTEEEIRRLWEDGQIPSLLHLDGSKYGVLEDFLCDFFHVNVEPTDWVLASHRCHYVYQLHGGQNIIEEVLAGRSMFLSHPRFISSAIVAGTASIAVGLGMAIRARGGSENVFCFVGDGACDHGHLLESIAFVSTKGLPVRFVILDNDSSCGVTKKQRLGESGPRWLWPPCVTKMQYEPRWPHAGSLVRPNLKWKQ